MQPDHERSDSEFLKEAPDGPLPEPPVATAEQLLPLHKLTWQNFERLCYRLVRLEATFEHAQLFGDRGQDQSGIDIFARRPDGRHGTYQCRRVVTLTDGDIANAVADFTANEWAASSSVFCLCTSHRTVRRERAAEIERQATLLRERVPAITFLVWDAEELSARLKDHPQLVSEFFGQAWLERFAPHHAGNYAPLTERRLEEILENKLSDARRRAVVVVVDWAPSRLQRALKEMNERDPERFESLTKAAGMPPRPSDLRRLIGNPPTWAIDASGDFWELVARLAESAGEWEASADAWEFAAANRDADGAARSLLAAAASAMVVVDTDRHDALVRRAEATAPHHPRLQLEHLREDASASEQARALEKLLPSATDPDDRLLISARLSLSRLLVPDVDGARALLPQIEALGGGSAIAEAVALNIAVQEGRVDVLEGRPLDTRTLRDAHDRGLKLRERLLRERRYEEGARLLMLAADCLSLIGERVAASTLLRVATAEELASPTGAVVLGDSAASRALDFRLALELLRDAPNDDPAVRRIRAEALEEVGTADEQEHARRELEDIVAEGGAEAPEAAFIRLAATLGGHHVDWSPAAEDFLMTHGYERVAVTARAFYLARWQAAYERAEDLLRPYRDQPWAKVVTLRLALTRRARAPLRAAADAVVALMPTQSHLVDAGHAYLLADEAGRSKQVLMPVARDRRAPSVVRGQAYSLLMEAVGKSLDDWKLAADLHREWRELRPCDTGVSKWAPTVEARSRNG